MIVWSLTSYQSFCLWATFFYFFVALTMITYPRPIFIYVFAHKKATVKITFYSCLKIFPIYFFVMVTSPVSLFQSTSAPSCSEIKRMGVNVLSFSTNAG